MKNIVLLALLLLVERAFFSACPDGCHCTRIKIFCRDTRIRSLPKGGTLSQMRLISMNGDILPYLNKSAISAPGLTTLMLINMHIEEIDAFTFTGVKELESLTITENRLNDLKPGSFSGLNRLYHLDLSYNKLTTLCPGIFEGLTMLRHLELRGNHIEHLRFGAFKVLRRFVNYHKNDIKSILDISENKIRAIEKGAFSGLFFFRELKIQFANDSGSVLPFRGLSGLRRLKLAQAPSSLEYSRMRGLYNLVQLHIENGKIRKLPNRFLADSRLLKEFSLVQGDVSELESGCFDGLRSLSTLDLSNNKLRNLHKNAFEHIMSLTKLNLSYNHVSTIEANAFQGLNRLRFLDLTNNSINSIDSNLLSDLVHLKELVLSDNKMITIPSEAFEGLPSLKSLHVPYIPRYYQSTSVKLSSLQRLDNFRGPGHFLANGLQVMATLMLQGFRDHIISYVKQWSREISHLKNPIQLTIHNLSSVTMFTILSGYDVSHLHLRDSNFSILQNSNFEGLTKLNSLRIDSKSKTAIQEGTFKHLHSLECLELYSDLGFELERGVFHGLVKLKKLVLEASSNWKEDEVTLRAGIFEGLQSVEELIVKLFYFSRLESGTFIKLENLQVLSLRQNSISNITEGAFEGLGKIEALDLAWNDISDIGIGVFGAICDNNLQLSCKNLTRLPIFCNMSFALQRLVDLNLDNNKIRFIHQHAFLGCNNMQTLSLSNNEIQTLNFLNTPQLRVLRYRHGNVTTMLNSFSCCSVLYCVDFQNTVVESMHLSTFEHLKKLETFVFPKIKFDCNLREIWLWLRSRHILYSTEAFSDQHIDFNLSALECNSSLNHPIYECKQSIANFFLLYIEPVVFICIFVTGFCGNGLLVFIIFRHSDMRKKNNACVAHLAITNLLLLICNLALSYWEALQVIWNLGETICKIFVMSRDLIVTLTVFTNLALTCERLLVVRASLLLRIASLSINPIVLLSTVWIYAVVTSVPSYFPATVSGRCMINNPHKYDYVLNLWTSQLFMNCIFPSALIIIFSMVSAYGLKASIVDMPSKFRNNSRFSNRIFVAKVMIITSIVFVMSIGPNFLLRALVPWDIWGREEIFWPAFGTYCLFFLHTTFYPISIFIMGSKYKRYIMQYARIFVKEVEKVPEPPSIKTALETVGSFLVKLDRSLFKNECVHAPVFPKDIAAQDEAIRRARQDRMNKIKERFFLNKDLKVTYTFLMDELQQATIPS